MKVENASFIPGIREEKAVFEKRIELCPETFLVFESEEKETAGYICAELMDRVPSSAEQIKLGHSPFEQTGNVLYISSFALLPSFRGKGNGLLLWNASLDYFSTLKNVETFVLLVNEVWHGARKIYEKSGFIKTCVFKDFFEAENIAECKKSFAAENTASAINSAEKENFSGSCEKTRTDGILMIKNVKGDLNR